MEDKTNDMVNSPSHYKANDLECIDEMIVMFGVEKVIAHCECNAWKYRSRADHKGNKEQDLAKANWYIKKALELQNKYADVITNLNNKYLVKHEE